MANQGLDLFGWWRKPPIRCPCLVDGKPQQPGYIQTLALPPHPPHRTILESLRRIGPHQRPTITGPRRGLKNLQGSRHACAQIPQRGFPAPFAGEQELLHHHHPNQPACFLSRRRLDQAIGLGQAQASRAPS